MASEQFLCLNCPQKPPFPSSRSYNRHLERHSKPYKCDQCGRQFGSQTDLSRHTLARHRVGQAKFSCGFDGCNFKAKRRDNLYAHEERAHRIQSNFDNTSRELSTHSNTTSSQTVASSSDDNDNQSVLQDHTEANFPLQYVPTLFQAASGGNIEILERSFLSGVDFSERADDGSTVLHCAARAGRTNIVKYLLDLGVSHQVKNQGGRAPIHEAILSGYPETVALFLQGHEVVYDLDARGKPAIEYALESLNTEIADLLLQHAGDEHFFNEQYSILHLAAKAGNSRAVTKALENGRIDVNALSSGCLTSLHLAAKFGRKEVVQTLLAQENINVNANTRNRSYQLIFPLTYAVANGHEQVVRLILAHKDLRMERRDFEVSALTEAARRLNYPILRLLLEYAKDEFQWSTLSWEDEGGVLARIAESESDDFEEILADPNVNINYAWRATLNDITALMASIMNRDMKLMIALLKRKDLNVNQSNLNHTALYIAARNGSIDATRRLLQRDDIDPNSPGLLLHLLSQRGKSEVVALLLQHKDINPNLMNRNGYTPLHLALRNDHVEVAKLLLAHERINVNEGEKNRPSDYYSRKKRSETPLDIALKKGQTEIVDILLSRGALTMEQLRGPNAIPGSGGVQERPVSASCELEVEESQKEDIVWDRNGYADGGWDESSYESPMLAEQYAWEYDDIEEWQSAGSHISNFHLEHAIHSNIDEMTGQELGRG